jgi:hypothetical protein
MPDHLRIPGDVQPVKNFVRIAKVSYLQQDPRSDEIQAGSAEHAPPSGLRNQAAQTAFSVTHGAPGALSHSLS